MNKREKNLLFILVAAVFLIGNFFAYTRYDAALKKKQIELINGEKELKMKSNQLAGAGSRQDEVDWLAKHMPADGTHAKVRSELVTLIEQSAIKRGLKIKKHPSAVRENLEEQGEFRSAIVKVQVNARDPELYPWLVELQNPDKSQAITRLRITPQRDDKTRVDCELEVTQWYTPTIENEPEIPNP